MDTAKNDSHQKQDSPSKGYTQEEFFAKLSAAFAQSGIEVKRKKADPSSPPHTKGV